MIEGHKQFLVTDAEVAVTAGRIAVATAQVTADTSLRAGGNECNSNTNRSSRSKSSSCSNRRRRSRTGVVCWWRGCVRSV